MIGMKGREETLIDVKVEWGFHFFLDIGQKEWKMNSN